MFVGVVFKILCKLEKINSLDAIASIKLFLIKASSINARPTVDLHF